MYRLSFSALALLLLSSCDLMPDRLSEGGQVVVPTAEAVETTPLDSEEGTAVTEAVPTFSGTATTIAGLGDPTLPGLWMETPLVTVEQKGRVRSASGAEVTLSLRPIAGEVGAGSRLSIDAMRALGAPLTELIELQVSSAS